MSRGSLKDKKRPTLAPGPTFSRHVTNILGRRHEAENYHSGVLQESHFHGQSGCMWHSHPWTAVGVKTSARNVVLPRTAVGVKTARNVVLYSESPIGKTLFDTTRGDVVFTISCNNILDEKLLWTNKGVESELQIM